MGNEAELRRLLAGPLDNEAPSGFLVDYIAACVPDSATTLRRAKEVWAIVLAHNIQGLSLGQWRDLLPEWFIAHCGPEISMEEALRRRALSMEERVRYAQTWSLSAWVHWLQPAERHWSWWTATTISPSALRITVAASSHPFPSGSLEWLFRCCGAYQFDETFNLPQGLR